MIWRQNRIELSQSAIRKTDQSASTSISALWLTEFNPIMIPDPDIHSDRHDVTHSTQSGQVHSCTDSTHHRESILIVQPPRECFWSDTHNGRVYWYHIAHTAGKSIHVQIAHVTNVSNLPHWEPANVSFPLPSDWTYQQFTLYSQHMLRVSSFSPRSTCILKWCFTFDLASHLGLLWFSYALQFTFFL